MRILIFLVVVLGYSINSFAYNPGFKCMPSLAQQSFSKDHYNIEGEQNPPIIHFDYTKEDKKTYFFKVIATGDYIHGLAFTEDENEAILKLDLLRVKPAISTLPNGVQITLDTKYAYTKAGLGMRDTYTTYVQNITAKLHNGKLGFIVLTCIRD